MFPYLTYIRKKDQTQLGRMLFYFRGGGDIVYKMAG